MITEREEAQTTREQRLALPIRVTCVTELEALRSRREEWNALVARNGTNTIFQTFEWQLSWLSAFRDSVQPLVLLAEADDQLLGIAPLLLAERRLLGRSRRTVEFIGRESSDYCDFIVADPAVLPLLLQWLVENVHLWDLLDLSNIAETSPLLSMLPEFLGGRGYATEVHLLYECPTRIFGDHAEDRKLASKKSLKRHYNYFRRSGELEFKRCTSVAEITGYLDLFFEQHVQRWRAAGFSSLFLDERNRAFYRELVTRVTPTGWLYFTVLEFNGTPIAFHFGFEYDRRIFWILPTFSTDLASHSPGEVLLKYSLEDALERDLAEFDFTVGEEPYKYRFSNHMRLSYAARVYRRSISFHLDRFLLGARALLKRSALLRKLSRRLRRRQP